MKKILTKLWNMINCAFFFHEYETEGEMANICIHCGDLVNDDATRNSV